MDNQAFLKSLQALETSLSDIDSARKQVQKVTNSASELSGIVSSYCNALKGISESITVILRDSRNFNLETLDAWNKKISVIQNEASKIFDATSSNLTKFESEESKIIERMQGKISIAINPIGDSVKKLGKKIDEFNNISSQLNKSIENLTGIQDEIQDKLDSFILEVYNSNDHVDNSINKTTDGLKGIQTFVDGKFTETSEALDALTQKCNKITEAIAKNRSAAEEQNALTNQRIKTFGIAIIAIQCAGILLQFLVG